MVASCHFKWAYSERITKRITSLGFWGTSRGNIRQQGHKGHNGRTAAECGTLPPQVSRRRRSPREKRRSSTGGLVPSSPVCTSWFRGSLVLKQNHYFYTKVFVYNFGRKNQNGVMRPKHQRKCSIVAIVTPRWRIKTFTAKGRELGQPI